MFFQVYILLVEVKKNMIFSVSWFAGFLYFGTTLNKPQTTGSFFLAITKFQYTSYHGVTKYETEIANYNLHIEANCVKESILS